MPVFLKSLHSSRLLQSKRYEFVGDICGPISSLTRCSSETVTAQMPGKFFLAMRNPHHFKLPMGYPYELDASCHPRERITRAGFFVKALIKNF